MEFKCRQISPVNFAVNTVPLHIHSEKSPSSFCTCTHTPLHFHSEVYKHTHTHTHLKSPSLYTCTHTHIHLEATDTHIHTSTNPLRGKAFVPREATGTHYTHLNISTQREGICTSRGNWHTLYTPQHIHSEGRHLYLQRQLAHIIHTSTHPLRGKAFVPLEATGTHYTHLNTSTQKEGICTSRGNWHTLYTPQHIHSEGSPS